MANPETFINNALFRAVAQHAGLDQTRFLVRHSLLQLIQPPWKMRRLRKRVALHLAYCFPCFSKAEVERLSRSFIYHWGCKFAEDCCILNFTSERMEALIKQHVRYEGLEHLFRATERGSGLVAVSAHVGGMAFCVNAFASIYRTIPKERRPKNAIISTPPEAERFSFILDRLRSIIEYYGIPIEFMSADMDKRDKAIRIAEVLSQRGFVTMNLDVLDGGKSRMVFPMFDRKIPIYLPATVGAAKVALRTGATILPWVNLRTKEGFVMRFEPPLGPLPRLGIEIPEDHPDLLQTCEHLRALLESWIVASPEQWTYWDRLHRRLAAEPAKEPPP